MRVSQVLVLLLSLLPGLLSAQSEADLLRQIRALQQQPDPSARAWLQEQTQHRAVATKTLREGRHDIALPRYPIAAAAHAALLELDVRERLQELHEGARPDFVGKPQEVEIRAWCALIERDGQAPTSLSGSDVPERLISCAARHTGNEAWRTRLIKTAEQGASLRWLDSQLPQLSSNELMLATENPALASSAWREWAHRANHQQTTAESMLLQTALDPTPQAGLEAGLAEWQGVTALLSRLHASPNEALRQRALRLRGWIEAQQR